MADFRGSKGPCHGSCSSICAVQGIYENLEQKDE